MRVRVTDYAVACLAASIMLSVSPAKAIVPTGNINTTNDGRIISGGNYYNTPGGITSFINSGSGGLWLKAGTTVRGEEVDTSGNLTSNGGSLHLYAPNEVVRVDGTINVNGAMSPQGARLGNGGNVFIDAGYLFQNGNIYANGFSGGRVQINVAGMTLGQGAQIQANATNTNGAGGIVAVNSSGPVDLRRYSIVETSGFGFEGTNVINIEGSLVNVDGLIKANSVQNNSFQGGTIRLVATGQSDLSGLKNILQNATQNSPNDTSVSTLSAQERTFILQRVSSQIQNHDGDVVISRDTQNATPTYIGQLNVNGAPPGLNDYSPANQGGSIIVNAIHDVVNQGELIADGAEGDGQGSASDAGTGVFFAGSGGTISLIAMNSINNDQGRIEANGGFGNSNSGYLDLGGNAAEGTGQIISGIVGGRGGSGGLIAFGYHTGMTNKGGIYADGGSGARGSQNLLNGLGGSGGLIVFSGNANPTGHGSIDVIGRLGGNNDLTKGGQSGTIVSPDPTTLGQGQVYFQQGYVNGNLVSTHATEQTQTNEVLVDGTNGDLISMTQNGGSSNPNLLTRLLSATYRTVDQPTGFKSTMLESGYASSFTNLVVESSQNNLAMDLNVPATFSSMLPSGQIGIFEYLGSLTIANNGPVILPVMAGPYHQTVPTTPNSFWLGTPSEIGITRVSILANGEVNNSQGSTWDGSLDIATKDNYLGGGVLTTSSIPNYTDALQVGSIIIKAGTDITQNTQNGSYLAAQGALFGGVIQLSALHDINYNATNFSGTGISSSISTDGLLQGGIINLTAGHNILMNATASSEPSGYASQAITSDGTATIGRGGFVSLHANNSNEINNVQIEANGGLRNGTVSLSTDP